MKISYKWLKEYIDIDLDVEKVSELLTDTGLEVEGLEEVESIKGGLKGIVVGEVMTCEQHPNADRLKKTSVDIGAGELLSIVCGAANVAAGQKVLVATIGSIIYGEDDQFEIKKSKLRGELSEGMICAEDELNLGDSHDGILVLDPKAKVGTPAAEYFKIESDFVFEIGLTPNRTDAMCHFGVARDLRAALLRLGEEKVSLELPSVQGFKVDNQNLPISISIEDSEACPRYSGTSISGVKVAPSPEWLQNRLNAIGLKPINNVVDVTNYVLHETGHPMHAFDAEKIHGKSIYVKKLPSGTKFTSLDEKERVLDENDLMICDAKKGLVIAGTMGGLESGVSLETSNIFLESAYFNPVSVRKTAKRHGLNTDSSFRYERGVDPNMGIYALKRAALLIQELAGGEISMDILDIYPNKIEALEVQLNLDRMNKLIGQEIEEKMVIGILESLDIKLISKSDRHLLVSVPTYRADVQREADLIEEVLRIYGFNAIEFGNKMHISVAQTEAKSETSYREKISTALSGRGFSEIMNNSLTKPKYYNGNGFNDEQSIKMLNPLSQDLEVMRQDLLFGGLEVMAYNMNRQRSDIKMYEFGKTYQKEENGFTEKSRLGIWLSGLERPESWNNDNKSISNFFSLKAEVNQILNSLGLSQISEKEQNDHSFFSNGLDFILNKKVVVSLGQIKPALLGKMDIRNDVYYADFNWKYLCAKAKKQKVQYKEIPKFPEVRRDLALLLDIGINYSEIKDIASRAERKLLRDINLFDVYEGKNLPSGKKSYAISFKFRDDSKTLNDKEIDKMMNKIISALQHQLKAELR
tara:strand:+ start:115496 stop:117925 length:2430 start_codon:yes stop_codon:yes gene_type:complete